MSHYTELCLSGGGTGGFNLLGAIEYLSTQIDLDQIDTFIGTSSGSMICYFLALGMKPSEIQAEITASKILERMKCLNIMSCIQGEGATSFLPLQDAMEKITVRKTGQLMTLEGLKKRLGKTLRCVTYNMNTRTMEILSPETNPDLPCITALRMSASLPFIFSPYEYNEGSYLDGGLANNFPIDLAKEKAIGICVRTTTNNEKNTVFDFLRFSLSLLSIAVDSNTEDRIRRAKAEGKHEIIIIPRTNSGVDFSVSTSAQLDMFSSGFKAAKEQYLTGS